MSTKSAVLEGMLEAAVKARVDPWDLKPQLEAAIRWLEPELRKQIVCVGSQWGDIPCGWDEFAVSVCRIFPVPDPKPKLGPSLQVFNTPFGRFTVDTRVPPGEIRLEVWDGPTLMRNLKTAPEGRCCERDTDGDGNCPVHSAPGIYRRGQNSTK